jgi:hypothetical protein
MLASLLLREITFVLQVDLVGLNICIWFHYLNQSPGYTLPLPTSVLPLPVQLSSTFPDHRHMAGHQRFDEHHR